MKPLLGSICLSLAISGTLLAEEEPLTFAFPERRPYYFFDHEGQEEPRGEIAERVIAATKLADIPAHFVTMPWTRILQETKSEAPFCSFAWYRTYERERYARFTVPIWQDEPYVVIARAGLAAALDKTPRFIDLKFDEPVRFGRMAQVSYGPYIDAILAEPDRGIVPISLVNDRFNMLRMIEMGRLDMILLTLDELSLIQNTQALPADKFHIVYYPDIRSGNMRHIMCSQALSEKVIQRLDKALTELYPRISGTTGERLPECSKMEPLE